MGDVYKAEVQENADIKADLKLSADELKIIEDLKLPATEETALNIEKKTDEYLKTILLDSESIIKAAKVDDAWQEPIKAIMTYLKIKSFYWELSLDFTWIDVNNWTGENLVKLLWYKYNENLIKSIWWEELWNQLVSLIDAAYNRYKDNLNNKINGNPRDTEWWAVVSREIPEGSVGNPEVSAGTPEWAEGHEEEFQFDNTTAVVYLEEQLWTVTTETLESAAKVSELYKKVMEKVKTDKNFVNALNTLLKNFGIDTWIAFDKSKKSDAITAFQNLFIDEVDDDNWWKKKVAKNICQTLYWTTDVTKIVDGRLWIRTLNAIVNWESTKDLLRKWAKREKELKVTVAPETKENKDDKWEVIKEMPRTINELRKYWKFTKEGGFVFYWEKDGEEWGKDYVKTDPEGKKFITIWETNYYLDDPTKQNFIDRSNWTEVVQKYWENVTEYHNLIRLWSMDWKVFVWQEFLIVDWKPKETLNAGPVRKWAEDPQFKSRLKGVKMNWENENWEIVEPSDKKKNRPRWRIDLYDKDWKDTKRLSKEQLDSLSVEDVNWVLDEAMDLYEKTEHRPTTIWQTNLNRILNKVMERTKWFGKIRVNPDEDGFRAASHVILWMNKWFSSNPNKVLEESDINDVKDDVLMTLLDVKKSEVEDYDENIKYDWSMRKWRHIINRLRILKAYVNKEENKWEAKRK